MAHFARLDENDTVTMVTVVSNADMVDGGGAEQESLGISVCESVIGPGPWVQTSYNGNFRRRYAGIGMRYDAVRDAFILPQPFKSWVLDENHDWQAPKPKPDDGQNYEWDEKKKNWVLVPEGGG